jgi:hypothetical protein
MKVWLRKLMAEVGLAEYLVPAFKFQCDACGAAIIAPVPEEGTQINLRCQCGYEHKMFWTGEFWRYQKITVGEPYEFRPVPVDVPTDEQIAKEAVDLLQKRGHGRE